MKIIRIQKICSVFLALAAAICLHVEGAALSESEITAETAVLIDADTGQVLFDKGMHIRRHPASITKVMTGLLTVESCTPDELATVSDEAVAIPYNSSHIALTPGEEIPVDSAMYALMLPSANDAANVLAEHVAGSQEAFAEKMTARAEELGAKNTTFTNPSGLPDDSHLTTAYDMAMITRAAIRNQDFLTYFGTARKTIPPTNLQEQERPLTNQQYMLLEDQKWCYNPDVIGGKVGYTDEARHTMTTAARKNGRTLIAVVMGCGIDQKFDDTQLLFDYGFDAFYKLDIAIPDQVLPCTDDGKEVGEAVFSAASGLSMLLPEGLTADDLVYTYHIPDAVELDKDPAASVTLTVKDEGILLEIPLAVKFPDIPGVKSSRSRTENADGIASDLAQLPWPLLIAVPPLALVLWILYRRYKIRRRAELRRLHRLRVLRERQYEYRRSS